MGALLDLKVFLGTPAPDDFEDDYLTAVYAMKAPGEDWVKQSFDDKPSLRQGNKTFGIRTTKSIVMGINQRM